MGRQCDDAYPLFIVLCLMVAMYFGGQMNKPTKDSTAPAPRQPSTEEHMSAAGITCPNCPDVPEGLDRVRKTALFEGPTIEYPTVEYASFLRGRCDGLNNPIGEVECVRLNTLIEEGRRYVESMANPIYGRGEFAKADLARVRHAAMQTMRTVRDVEHLWVGTQPDRFQR